MVRPTSFTLMGKEVLGHAIITPPYKASPQMHDEARFIHIVNGKTRLIAPQDQYDLMGGDSIVMRCDNFVNHWLKTEDGSQGEAIIFRFYPEVFEMVYGDQLPDFFSSDTTSQARPVEKFHTNPMMANFIHSLKYFFDNPTLISEDLLKVKIQELILILVNTDTSGRIKATLRDLFRATEYEFKDIIYSNLYQDVSVEDLAFLSGLSLSSFRRKFKSVYQSSPTQYIKTKRLEKAESLLISSEMRISDIAYDTGFNDLGYFSKSFHAAYALSPSDYRKHHQEGISK